MKKVFDVTEFDTISAKAGIGCKTLDKETFEDLCEFVKTYQTDEKESSDALEFFKLGFRRDIGDTISVRNYVGLIQTKTGKQIEILPKILFDQEDSGSYKQTKLVFLKMIRAMKDFPSKLFDNADLKAERMNLYEIFINMYLGEVRNLVKHGLKSGYETVEDNLHYYKGKLNVTQQIKRNATHKERFCVKFDEFTANRPENRLIKATLEKLLILTQSQWNAREARQLLDSFENVEKSNVDADLASVVTNRNMLEYETLIKWSRIFLKNKAFTTFSGTSKARALLFPMDKVFESYVAREIRNLLSPQGWNVSTQDSRYFLFDTPRQFSLRPDIVIDCGGDKRIIMDTKWKSLINSPRANYGISQADMYQMYAYSKKYKTSEIWLLYPMNEEMKDQPIISFKAEEDIPVNVHVFFVDLAKMNDSMAQLKAQIEGRIP